MSRIILTHKAFGKRRLTLEKIFRPLSPSNRVDVFFRSGANQTCIGLGQDTFGTKLRNARHPSRINTVFLNYFEVWVPKKGGTEFSLEKAYLHIDMPLNDGQNDEEVLAVHCDPNATDSEPSFVYKKGPHLHISGNKRDISKAHIALCLPEIDAVCANVDQFSNAYSEILHMINEEIFPYL